MPIPSSILIPDYNQAQVKSGVLVDGNNINYPLVRFQDEVTTSTLTGVSGTYSDGQIIGTQLSFASCAANVGWGGAVTGVQIDIGNTVLASDTLSLLLFNTAPAATAINSTNLSALTLADTEGDAFMGVITLANALALSNRVLFSSSGLNLKYVCGAASTTLTGILVLNSSASRTLSSARINTNLQITKS